MHRRSSVRKALLAGFVAIGLAPTAFGQTSTAASGLGQSWPNAADLSANPHWHVYVFMLNGIKYVQINDLYGTVHAAIGTAGDTTIVLPIGVDSRHVSTAQTSAIQSNGSNVVTVYHDDSTIITATLLSNGAIQFNATPLAASCKTYNCGGGRGH